MPRQAPEAGAGDAALFFGFFDFESFAADAPPGALDAAVLAAAGAWASEVVVFGAGFVPGLIDDDDAFVGGADDPLTVKPAASRLVTDFAPSPFTRAARSSAFLNGPLFVRSSMIALA
ncbi:MAG: hypothetical protein QOI13_676 [Paraburkholderia sp.]|nr:hypothetical protein [Paraburkholderia sp.]